MKKIISCVLAFAMLITVAVSAATTVGAEEDLCKKFDDVVSGIYYGMDNLSDLDTDWAISAAYYTAYQYIANENDFAYWNYNYETGEYYKEDYGDRDYGHYIEVNADRFDEAVKKCFNYNGDFRKDYIAETEEYKAKEDFFGEYNEADNTYYVWWNSGRGSETDYRFAGYAKTDGGYRAYIKGVNEDGSDRTAEQDPYYAVFDIEYSGSYIKVNDFHTVKEVMPSVDGLITYPDVMYDLPTGVTIDADDCFGEGTMIYVSSYDDIVVENNAKKALKAVVGDGKVVAFHIDAYNRLSWYGDSVQPTKPVKITFDIPEGLTAKDLKLFYIPDEGAPEEVQITVDEQNNKVTAVFEHFSTYAFCNVEGSGADTGNSNNGQAQTKSNTNTETAKSPKTGDNSNIIFAVMLLSLSAAICSSVILLKDRKKSN